MNSERWGLVGLIVGYAISYALGFLSIPVSTPREINLMPAFAKDTATNAQTVVRLPVSISVGLSACVLASFFMGRRTSLMKPVNILRKL